MANGYNGRICIALSIALTGIARVEAGRVPITPPDASGKDTTQSNGAENCAHGGPTQRLQAAAHFSTTLIRVVNLGAFSLKVPFSFTSIEVAEIAIDAVFVAVLLVVAMDAAPLWSSCCRSWKSSCC